MFAFFVGQPAREPGPGTRPAVPHLPRSPGARSFKPRSEHSVHSTSIVHHTVQPKAAGRTPHHVQLFFLVSVDGGSMAQLWTPPCHSGKPPKLWKLLLRWRDKWHSIHSTSSIQYSHNESRRRRALTTPSCFEPPSPIPRRPPRFHLRRHAQPASSDLLRRRSPTDFLAFRNPAVPSFLERPR